jgi:hypothetical protein
MQHEALIVKVVDYVEFNAYGNLIQLDKSLIHMKVLEKWTCEDRLHKCYRQNYF